MRVGFVKKAGLRYPIRLSDDPEENVMPFRPTTMTVSRTRQDRWPAEPDGKRDWTVTTIQPLVATPVETSVVRLTFLQSTRLYRMDERHYGHLDYLTTYVQTVHGKRYENFYNIYFEFSFPHFHVSHFQSPRQRCILCLWLLQDTNRKAGVGSSTHWSACPYSHRNSRFRRIRYAAAPAICPRRIVVSGISYLCLVMLCNSV